MNEHDDDHAWTGTQPANWFVYSQYEMLQGLNPTSIQNKGWSKDGIGDRWLTGSGLLPHEDAAAHFPIGY